ncbi:MAG: MBL fold metallo-hydrolase [Acidobacteria bacterium]|nr:MBL fold metallo-hydrolase [Acidobacteriota bacterium]
MADKAQRWAENTPGDFFVDRTCIDCDQCREIAPETFGDAPSHAAVYHQPNSPEHERRALMALVACPVGAIGSERRHNLAPAVEAFPEPIENNVYFCGFASANSYGASSYLIVRPEGNVLMDSPRFASRLVRKIEQMGGIRWMFLSHVDDIADHAKFRQHFGCERIIHRREIHSSIADIEQQIKGDEPQWIAPDLLAIPTPGHTRGHTVLLYRERLLFTGDHLWWSPERQSLSASSSYCWYSWKRQIESMERLLDYPFEWVLPGHGRRYHASADEMHDLLARCVAWMRQAA